MSSAFEIRDEFNIHVKPNLLVWASEITDNGTIAVILGLVAASITCPRSKERPSNWVGTARFDLVVHLVRFVHSNQRLVALSGLKGSPDSQISGHSLVVDAVYGVVSVSSQITRYPLTLSCSTLPYASIRRKEYPSVGTLKKRKVP